MKSSNPGARAAAARKLAVSRDRKAVPALIEALGDESASVRIEAANALGDLAHPAAVEPLAASLASLAKAASTRRAGADKNAGAAVCEAFAAALGKQGAPAVPSLVLLLASEDREARRCAALALALIRDPRTVVPLAERLDDSRAEVRRAAAHALAEIGDSAALAPLKKALANRDPETRKAVVEAFGAIGGESAARALAAAVVDENETVQLAAVDALRRIGGLGAAYGLREALEAGRKRSVTEAAALALKSIRIDPRDAGGRAAAAVLLGDFDAAVLQGEASIDAITEALGSRDAARRRQAAEALGQLRSQKGVQPLLNTLKDYDAQVRESAAQGLAAIGSPAVDGLGKCLESPDAVVAALAARALGQIGAAHPAGALADAVARNHSATSSYLEPLEAVRAAAAALGRILASAASEVSDEDLARIASVPDGILEHPEGVSDESRRPERAVDCAHIREMARQELDHRTHSNCSPRRHEK